MAQTPRFERQSFFQAAAPDNSAAQVASGLASALQNFSQTALSVGGNLIAINEKNQKLALAAEDAQVAAAADDIAINIDFAKKQFSNDVEKFKQYVTSSSKGTISSMSDNVKQKTLNKVNKSFGIALNDVSVAQEKNLIAELKVGTGETVKNSNESGANAARELDQESVLLYRDNLISSMNNALYTTKERKVALDNYDIKIRQEQMTGNVLLIAKEDGYLQAYATLQKINETGIKGIHPSEVSTAVAKSRQVLDQQRKVIDKQEKVADDVQDKISEQITNDALTQATLVHNKPELQADVLDNAQNLLIDGDIDHKQFKSIRDELNAPDGHDNVLEVEDIYTGIYSDLNPQETDLQISEARVNGFLTPEKATELRKANQLKKNRISTSQSLTSFELANKNAYSVLKIKLTGSNIVENVMGINKKRVGDALSEYHMRIQTAPEDGLTPIDITNDIAQRYSTEKLTLKSFATSYRGQKTDRAGIIEARLLAEDAFNAGEISEDEYLREINLYDDIESIIPAIGDKPNVKQ